MNELHERLRSGDPSALEELGHALLPFVQAAAIAPAFSLSDAGALLAAFREEVARALAAVSPDGFAAAVVAGMRARALPPSAPDGAQAEALSRLRALAPLATAEREVVIARFVERLPGDLLAQHFARDVPAISAILARGAALLVGPPAAGGDWASAPSLLDPNALPVAQFLALENVLTALAIDVTALEVEPLRAGAGVAAPVPVLRPGYEARAPAEQYPSTVGTQAASDLPAEVSHFAAPPPSAPSVVVALEHTPPMPARPLPRDDRTEPQGRPLAAEVAGPTRHTLPPVEDTGATRAVLKKVADEPTHVKGQSLAETTEPRARAIADPADGTDVGVAVASRLPDVPLHRRVPPAWWWGGAGLCAVLGVGLFLGLIRMVEVRTQRPWTMVPVLVATRDFDEGLVLGPDMLAVRAIPEQNASNSVVKPDAMPDVVGRRLEFPMQAGDPLLWANFDPSVRHKRFDVIRHGRAYSIAVTELKSIGGQLEPSDEVDLLMTFTAQPGKPKEKATERAITLLQKVRVLAVGKVTTLNVGRIQKRYTDLTLMLVPEEVEIVSLALRTGELTASMRNGEDSDTVERGETTMQTLLNGERQRRLMDKRGQVIKVLRGQK